MKKFLIFATALLAFAACDPKEPIDDPDNGDQAPSITEVRNSTGVISSAKQGTAVQIVGTNLADVTSVKFNGTEADLSLNGTTITAQLISVTIPASAPAQAGTIVVTNAAGSDDIAFTVESATVTPPDPDDDLVISNLGYGPDVSTAYALPGQKADVQIGDLAYCDRPANEFNTIFSFPEGSNLAGGTMITTSADGRAYIGETPYIVFNINREAEVIVAWNQGGAQRNPDTSLIIPAWLSAANGWSTADPTFTDATAAIRMGTADTKDTVWLFRKTFPAGKVELGRNMENADGSGRNSGRSPYFVIVK